MMKVFAVSCLLAVAGAAPAPEAEADAQFLAAAPYHAVATNCKTETDVLVTQKCTPSTENVCTKSIVETEEIEYEKVCQDVVSKICDAPALGYHAIGKREADAEADPQFFGGYAAHHIAPLAATAVAHTVEATVKHACRDVTTEHCVDNPKVKAVPVEVETCHTVTKVTCEDVENLIPKTICEPVETKHVSHAGYAAHGLGYAGYGYGK
eukprot:TRINITY_DN176_c1_g1_i3.p1 TRINITY_DN176_c1_g1~~TRINITY_DN176_c1_g1_i3.p1  ORF type:complete len:209 (-),score=53.82 TRINITY_DN176_c1_g1_i3:134-760(-)